MDYGWWGPTAAPTSSSLTSWDRSSGGSTAPASLATQCGAQHLVVAGGAQTLEGVMDALEEIGYDGWITVELDAWQDPLEGAQLSRRALERWAPVTSTHAQ
jgi:sugar phosphate isomerase/epimerase